MFADTSALVAIITQEPDREIYLAALADNSPKFTSPLVVLEATMVLTSRLAVEPAVAFADLNALLAKAGVTIAPIAAEHAVLAVQAFATYGKGRQHPAQLNLADCLSYACAKRAGMPMLYKGDDFALTDAKMSG